MTERLYTTRELRQRVEIQNRDKTQDETGQPSTKWDTIATVFAAIETISGDEMDFVQSLQLKTTHKVTIRYTHGITGKDQRIVYQGRIFSIVSVRDWEERHRTLSIYCEEGRTP